MNLKYTRALISAALNGELDHVNYQTHQVFGVAMPKTCPGVPVEMLNPRNTWSDKEAYDQKANHLATAFLNNFEKFADYANEEILAGAPKMGIAV
jgi:phosphoenolpyruvate carboxykinase (ATP)